MKAVVHAGATGYGSPDFGKAFGNDANGPFALIEPGPGFMIEKLRPEGQRIERAYRDAVKARTGAEIAGGHQLAGGGLWVLKLVLDAAKTDDPDKFRAAVMALDMPTGTGPQRLGREVRRVRSRTPTRACSTTCSSGRTGTSFTVWPEEFATLRAKWIPLGPWDQRK